MLEVFYQSVVSSTIFFVAVCWGRSIRASDTNRLEKIIKKAGSVLGLRLESFESVVERRTLNKLLSIIDNDQHPRHHTVVRQRSTFSHRLLQLRCPRDRYRKSFLPHAITLYNNSYNAGHNNNNTISKHLICFICLLAPYIFIYIFIRDRADICRAKSLLKPCWLFLFLLGTEPTYVGRSPYCIWNVYSY